MVQNMKIRLRDEPGIDSLYDDKDADGGDDDDDPLMLWNLGPSFDDSPTPPPCFRADL